MQQNFYFVALEMLIASKGVKTGYPALLLPGLLIDD